MWDNSWENKHLKKTKIMQVHFSHVLHYYIYRLRQKRDIFTETENSYQIMHFLFSESCITTFTEWFWKQETRNSIRTENTYHTGISFVSASPTYIDRVCLRKENQAETKPSYPIMHIQLSKVLLYCIYRVRRKMKSCQRLKIPINRNSFSPGIFNLLHACFRNAL